MSALPNMSDSSRRSVKTGRGRRKPMHMQYIASVSRSSGLEKDGDALKDSKVQEEYREYVQEKLDALWNRHPRGTTESSSQAKHRVEAQENLLISFRKLREGIYSSQRHDSFALEVYETSLYLAILFNSSRQVTSILSHLVPDLYLKTPHPHHRCLQTILISLLYHLVLGYPSQIPFRQHLRSVHLLLVPESEAQTWISSLASSLRSCNYVIFEQLTRPSALSHILEVSSASLSSSLSSLSISWHSNPELAKQAYYTSVDSLRSKARESTWMILRSAYRELSCHTDTDGSRVWLARSLALDSAIPRGIDVGVDEWLEKNSKEGHVRAKEGADGRWIICRAR